jgi:hypothetical protein
MDARAQLRRIEELEAEAIDRFHRRILALRRDKETLRRELESDGPRAAIVRRVCNPLNKRRPSDQTTADAVR